MNRYIILFLLFILLATSACASLRGPKLSDLNKDVEAFHKDLIFQRYSIAAKSLKPSMRADYLNNINQQQLRFAEIETLSVEPCLPDKNDCMYVTNQVQWYAGHSPVVSTSTIIEKWNFEENSGGWIMTEQEAK